MAQVGSINDTQHLVLPLNLAYTDNHQHDQYSYNYYLVQKETTSLKIDFVHKVILAELITMP